jgi:hypothetical protein
MRKEVDNEIGRNEELMRLQWCLESEILKV